MTKINLKFSPIELEKFREIELDSSYTILAQFDEVDGLITVQFEVDENPKVNTFLFSDYKLAIKSALLDEMYSKNHITSK